jgi:glycosyltransferase involved in cell wall biosynthesis
LTSDNPAVKYNVNLRKIGVVIPAYNAEKTIAGVVKELIKYGFEKDNIIVVNDGSYDCTLDMIRGQGVTLLQHEKNLGKGAALKDGFAAAAVMNLKKVFVIDADAQHRVSDAGEFLKLNGSYDMVIGQRTDILSSMPLHRQLSNRTVNLVVSLLSGVRTTDVQCGFRFLDLKIFDRMHLRTNNYQTESEMVIRAARSKYRIGFVPISTIYGDEKSHIRGFIDTMRFVNMAVRFLWR